MVALRYPCLTISIRCIKEHRAIWTRQPKYQNSNTSARVKEGCYTNSCIQDKNWLFHTFGCIIIWNDCTSPSANPKAKGIEKYQTKERTWKGLLVEDTVSKLQYDSWQPWICRRKEKNIELKKVKPTSTVSLRLIARTRGKEKKVRKRQSIKLDEWIKSYKPGPVQ